MNAKDHYQAGQLDEAVAAAIDEVKRKPTDSGTRGFLCELLGFSGDLERVDKHLDLIGHQDPQVALGVSLFRHLVRAEQARQQFFSEGRVPEFLTQPTPTLSKHLEASIFVREGEPDKAASLLSEAEASRPHVSGTCDGAPFDDLRDLDDLLAPLFEVLTSNGKYYWIPLEQVELIEFRPIARPRDLLWRRARMVVKDGPDGEVYFPTLYAGSAQSSDDRIRLGRMTDWQGGEGTPVRGLGLRTFLVGDQDRSILEIEELEINCADGQSAG